MKGEFEEIMKRFLFLILAGLIFSMSVPANASANSSSSLISSARNYLGIPYKYGGATTSGFDCSAYTQRVFKDVGISIPRTTGGQYGLGTPVSKSNLQVGDLVFFNTTGRGVSHVGIYIGNSNFIHASTSKGVSIASINDPYYWGKRYLGAKRVKNFNTVQQAVVQKPATVQKPAPVAVTPVVNYPTRAEIAEALVNKLNLTTSTTATTFNDVPNNHPQLEAITAVAEAGIFSGSNGSFMPAGNLTRAQMAKVLVEAFGLQGQSDISFNDVPAGHWAKEYIAILYHNGITTGYGNGNFGVDDKVTMTQLDTFIKRISAN